MVSKDLQRNLRNIVNEEKEKLITIETVIKNFYYLLTKNQ